ncbi:hypothetical protein ACLHDG_00185 [Sulfurovum sp. CS9]|uniref:hypothetical protein n=1 Tax=Sulfurovum sp. CS9 TaxID=3391146 RepID=UPI0039EC3864
MANILKLCEDVLNGTKGGMHYKKIAEKIIILDSSVGNDLESVAKKVAASLAKNVSKTKGSKFARIPNGKGGHKAGMYKLKPKKKTGKKAVINTPINTLYTGKAGEYAVFSELLYWGYNPAMVTVDHGIDIIAAKDTNYFHIQVKTANEIGNKPYNFSIKKSSFNRYNNSKTFYIFVLRQQDKNRYFNDFVIISNNEIDNMIGFEIKETRDTYSFKIQKSKGQYELNGRRVIVNDFSKIK